MATTQTIRTEPIQAQPRWTGLSGTILEGGYELQDLLEASDNQARFKVRVLGDRELESVALVFQLPETEIEKQVELWQSTRQLRHPNLRAPMGTGRLTLDGALAAYVVIRRADEALSAALDERALTTAEAGEVLMSVARALEALHVNGLTHGCVSPDVVLAVGNAIQLPAECVRAAGVAPIIETMEARYLAPESRSVNLTPEADLWCLGATLFEALSKKPWTEESREEVAALPEPFASIAIRCLETDPETRCKLAEAVALFRGELKPAPRVRTVPKPSAATPIVIPEEQIAPAPERALKQATPLIPKDVAKPEAPLAEEQPKAKLPVDATPIAAAVVSEPVVAASAPAAVPTPLSAATPAASIAEVKNPGVTDVPRPVPVNAPPAPVPPQTRTAEAQSTASSPAAPSNSASSSVPPRPSLVSRRPAWEQSGTKRLAAEEDQGTKKLWMGAGLALLLVIFLVWALWPKHPAPVATSGRTENPGPPAARQSNSTTAWQTHTVGPNTATPTGKTAHGAAPKARVSPTAPDAVKASSSHSPSTKAEGAPAKNVWRVVLYTYNREADAERTAKAINTKHNNLHVEVFSPSGGGSPYLVATTGQTNREDAMQARHRAMAAGIAHDAYVQNYSK